MREIEVSFPSGRLTLEGRLALPDGQGPFPAVVVCHPHPLHGGNMHSSVVRDICEALAQASIAALRFNFRGVGRSQGTHDMGRGERRDVAAAVDSICRWPEVDSSRVGLAGYSAGAAYSFLFGIRDERIKAMALVAPPLPRFDFTPLKECLKPRFFICGDRDQFVTEEQYLQFCRALLEPKECHTVEGADHFLMGREGEVAEKVAAFFARWLK